MIENPRDSLKRMVLTPAQIAELYGVSVAFVYREVHRGRLRAARLGRAFRITPDDAQAWFNDSVVGA